MTKKRRILSVIMAVALVASMMFAMTANTYAATDAGNITVNFVFLQEGDDLGLGGSITIPANHTRLYEVPNPTDDTSMLIPDSKVSVMDATLWYLEENGCYDATENALTWFREPLQKEDGTWYVKNWGGMIESMFATPNERTNDPTDQNWWKGNAWIYSVNGVESELFATNVEATDGMTITWNYKYVEEELN